MYASEAENSHSSLGKNRYVSVAKNRWRQTLKKGSATR